MPPRSTQHLLIDADDTLWENEGYFREMLTVFLDLMETRGHAREEALTRVRKIEADRTHRFGYGSRNFAKSLVETVRLMEGQVGEDLHRELVGFGEWIYNHALEIFPRVPETLEALASRHRLVLVTKGARDEQESKIARSGLSGWFETIEVLPEKDAARYRSLVERHALEPTRTWMVGNSPRSDINPARAAGLRTVFIPHRSIWEFELAPFDADPDLHLDRFHHLLDHF